MVYCDTKCVCVFVFVYVCVCVVSDVAANGEEEGQDCGWGGKGGDFTMTYISKTKDIFLKRESAKKNERGGFVLVRMELFDS